MIKKLDRLSKEDKFVLSLMFVMAIIHMIIVFLCFDFSLDRKIIICAFVFLIWLFGMSSVILQSGSERDIKDIGILLTRQISIIAAIFVAFFVSAYISSYTNIAWGEKICVCLSISISICLISVILYYLLLYKKNNNFVKDFFSYLKSDKMILLIIFLTVITRVGMLDTLQRWDAGEYYYALGNACSEFDFTWTGFFDGFRLCNHTTLGYSFIMSIAEFLNPRGVVGVLLLNLLLTTWAFVRLYKILVNIFEDTSKNVIGVIVLIASVIPFVLGGFGYLTPDYVMLIAFILAICSEYNKEYILQFFWLCICLNTKESAIFAIFGYFVFKLISLIVCEKNIQKICLKKLIKNPSLWMGVLAALMFIVGLCMQGGFLWKGRTNEKAIQFSSTQVNSFGINWDYILFRLKQHFVLNFSWIFTVLIVISVVYAIIKKKSFSDVNKKIFMNSMWGYLLFALLTNCIFITAGAYRYTIIYIFCYGLTALLLFWELVAKNISKKITGVILTFILLLNFVEAFIHIDPVSAVVFETRTTGNWYTVLTNYTHNTYGNDLCNNRQYAYLDEVIDKMLTEINYDGLEDLILLGGQEQGSQINGNGAHYRVCWDNINKERVIYDEVMLEENKDLILITCTNYDGLIEKSQINFMSPVAYAIFIPYYEVNEEECLASISQFYNIGERQEVTVMGTSIVYYGLALK